MELRLYSIKDVKTGVFFPPFSAHNPPDAMRHTISVARQGMLKDFAEDFDLYEVGEFNDKSGEVQKVIPVQVCRVFDLLHKPDPETPNKKV